MEISFLGAAGEVTGSCYLVDTGKIRFIVDCGMFQGHGAARRNAARLAFKPRELAFVLLTHAHIDHSGLLPRLTASGFTGPIHATTATCDLLGVMLPDSAHLQEKEAEYAQRSPARGRNDGRRGVTPLYTVQQAQACLQQLAPIPYDTPLQPHPDVRCVFRDAGHILGSSIIEVWIRDGAGETKIVFSGDLGQPGHPIVREPARIESADVLLVESTYGNRLHKNLAQTLDEFAYALTDTLRSRQGNVVIPSFAVGRTQDILYFIYELYRQHRLPAAEIYVDSPMAIAATQITLNHPEMQDRGARGLAEWLVDRKLVDRKLVDRKLVDRKLVDRKLEDRKDGPRLHFTATLEESMRINSQRSGAIIISASGMCDGGRIRHHLRYNIGRPQCAIVFVGFQAAGTLGRRIVDGARSVRMFGESHPVRAKVFTINGLSAHADQAALLGWVSGFRSAPRQTWVVHGEPLAAHAFRDEIETRLGWSARVPEAGEKAALTRR